MESIIQISMFLIFNYFVKLSSIQKILRLKEYGTNNKILQIKKKSRTSSNNQNIKKPFANKFILFKNVAVPSFSRYPGSQILFNPSAHSNHEISLSFSLAVC